jgi:glycosyltransferase involved in cell wall biosynthesis
LGERLTRFGHQIVPFAMRDSRNLKSPWSRHFVSPVQTERVTFSWQGLRTAGRVLYSFEASRKFAALLDEAKPAIVHVHNIYHQISPSILPEARKRGLPTVMTAHDYSLIAPNYSLFHDGAICEVTKPDRFWNAVGHRCVKGSKPASALEAAAMALHRSLRLYSDNLDLIIAPSRFLKATLESYGIPSDMIVHIPHFVETASRIPISGGRYALFVGRLSPEKGVETLIRAAARGKDIPVRIVGIGPEEARLKRLAADLHADNVEFRGFKQGKELEDEYRGAAFVVVPSVWYEVFGLTALEAFAHGKPVIASQIGGLAEVVRDGETGLAVSAGEPDELVEAMCRLRHDSTLAKRLGKNARSVAETEYDPEKHVGQIMWAYALAAERTRLRAKQTAK